MVMSGGKNTALISGGNKQKMAIISRYTIVANIIYMSVEIFSFCINLE